MTFIVDLASANRMMTRARTSESGLEVVFADGAKGLIPWSEIPEVPRPHALAGIELPNAYEIIIRSEGREVEIPWDFARHYCDPGHAEHSLEKAASGRESLGERLRGIRKDQGLSQDAVAKAAGIGRVTLVRIERGEQSPRLETLEALAKALQRDISDLLVP